MTNVGLTDRLQNGDKSAFEEIYLTFHAPLCEYASHFVEDADAEELVSDLMLYIWESRKSLDIHTSLKSYLFAAVKFRCLNAIKKNKVHQRVHGDLYEKLQEQFSSPDYYFVNELSEAIHKAIEELPETYRDTFKMSRFGIETNAQIAEKLNVSVKTIEYRITSSLKILHLKLKDYLFFVSLL